MKSLFELFDEHDGFLKKIRQVEILLKKYKIFELKLNGSKKKFAM